MDEKATTIVTIREYAKDALDDAASTHQTSKVEFLTKLVVAFILLPEEERQAMMLLGNKSSNMLKAGLDHSIKTGWLIPDDLEGWLNEP